MRKLPGWSVAAAWVRVEQEAALSMFSYSDLGRGGTNQEGARPPGAIPAGQNITLSARHHIVTPIRIVHAGHPINRLQVDVSSPSDPR